MPPQSLSAKKHNSLNRQIAIRLLFIGLMLVLLGRTPGSALAFRASIHTELTQQGLPFLKSGILEDIKDEHWYVDTLYSFDSRYHVDNCYFQEATALINRQYDRAIAALNPADPDVWDATDAFGQLLHTSQDFYAHSNWVESGQTGKLVESGLGKWTELKPFTLHQGVVVIEGEQADIPAGFTLKKNADKTITVTTPQGIFPGLVSGTFGLADECPDSVSIKHGSERAGEKSTLNKDAPARDNFSVARNLALQQTRHEWCRLVELVRSTRGQPGVDFLFNQWVADRGAALAACSAATQTLFHKLPAIPRE